MVDNKQDKEETDNAVPKPAQWRVDAGGSAYVPSGHTMPKQAAELPPCKPEMSKGEKIYNWVVYKGINYWVNLISSLAIADYFIHGRGKIKLDKGAVSLGNLVASTGLASSEKAIHHAQTVLKTSVLTSGGWALLIPGTFAENRKRPIVHWINEKMGVDQHAPDGHKETPDEIYIEQEQPHQTPWNALKRRTMAWLSVVGAGHVINAAFRDRKNTGIHHGQDDYHGGKAVVERFVVGNINKMAKAVLPEGHWFTKEKGMSQRWFGLAALDTLFTYITASVMYLTNGAKKARMPQEIGDDFDPPGSDATPNVITIEPEHNFSGTVTRADPAHKKILPQPHTARLSARLTAEQDAPPLHSV